MAAPILLKLVSAQTHNRSVPGGPVTLPTAESFESDNHLRVPNISAANFRGSKSDLGYSGFKNILRFP